jgi:hypothetical protein
MIIGNVWLDVGYLTVVAIFVYELRSGPTNKLDNWVISEMLVLGPLISALVYFVYRPWVSTVPTSLPTAIGCILAFFCEVMVFFGRLSEPGTFKKIESERKRFWFQRMF